MSFIEQFPIVFDALNVGFIQTLKLFIITLVGALPFGLVIAFGSMSKFKPLSAVVKTLVWVIRGTPLMLQLLVIYYLPGLVFHNNIWGSGEEGRFIASVTAFIIKKLLDRLSRIPSLEYADTGVQLETNTGAISSLEMFDRELIRRKTCYIKKL